MSDLKTAELSPSKPAIRDVVDAKPFGGTSEIGRTATALAHAEAEERRRWESWWVAKKELDQAHQAYGEAINARAKVLTEKAPAEVLKF